MTASLAQAAPGEGAPDRIIKLTALFWAFSYVLLSIRGSLFFDDWGRLLDSHRALAVTVGAAAYALVLKQLGDGIRLTLRSAIGWVAAATFAVMIVRIALDELLFDVPQGIAVNLLWSLTWSAYFALWVMGSLAFAPVGSMKVATPAAVTHSGFHTPQQSADAFDLLAQAILAEASLLKAADRSKLAARILELGGYQCADELNKDGDRARLALRIAERISAGN